jgi:hypothetical protein
LDVGGPVIVCHAEQNQQTPVDLAHRTVANPHACAGDALHDGSHWRFSA